MAKYIETQYRQSASTSSLITGKQSKSSTARFNRVRKIAKSEYQLRHVRPYVRMEQLSSQWTDFDEIWYLNFFFANLSSKIQISLKSDKKNGYFTGRRFHIYNNISMNSS